jgi:hypothetical protein
VIPIDWRKGNSAELIKVSMNFFCITVRISFL